MTNHSLGSDRICLVLALAVFAGCSVHRAQDLEALQDARAIDDFNSRIQAYISIHHQAEAQSGLTAHPEALSSSREIARRKGTMAKKIAALRGNTNEGDIFTPEVSAYFAHAIESAYQASPEALSTAVACAPQWDEHLVVANAVYPQRLGFSVMTPTMLRRLPPFPHELEYRIVNRDLIIRDREANLIVDIMRNAVAAAPKSAGCND